MIKKYLIKKAKELCPKKDWQKGKCGCEKYAEIGIQPDIGFRCRKDFKLY